MNFISPSTPMTCPVCRGNGVKVSFRTLEALIPIEGAGGQRIRAPRLCRTRACPVVYLDRNTSTVIAESPVSVPVWIKQPNLLDGMPEAVAERNRRVFR